MSSGSWNKYVLYILSYFLLIKGKSNSICTYNSRMLLINDKTKLGTFSNFHQKKTKFLMLSVENNSTTWKIVFSWLLTLFSSSPQYQKSRMIKTMFLLKIYSICPSITKHLNLKKAELCIRALKHILFLNKVLLMVKARTWNLCGGHRKTF